MRVRSRSPVRSKRCIVVPIDFDMDGIVVPIDFDMDAKIAKSCI